MQKFKYSLEADWIVNSLCNFSCDYCMAENEKEVEGILAYSLEHYSNFFSRYGTWMLHLSGGEPLLHMRNVELIAHLTKSGHFVSLNSNLSQEVRVNALAKMVDPNKVEYVHVGVHPIERAKKNGWPTLLRNVSTLKAANFEVFASVVMSPFVFGLPYENARDRLADVGVTVIPKVMRSPDFGMRHPDLIGTRYPEQYTEEQRALLRGYAKCAADSRPDLLDSFNTVNPMIDVNYLEGFPDFKAEAALCDAGRKFFKIDELGKIWRCDRTVQHGDIGMNWLSFDLEAQPCHEKFCPYYCLKYSDHLAKKQLLSVLV